MSVSGWYRGVSGVCVWVVLVAVRVFVVGVFVFWSAALLALRVPVSCSKWLGDEEWESYGGVSSACSLQLL